MSQRSPTTESAENKQRIDRRALLVGTGVAAAGLVAYPLLRRAISDKEPVFLAQAANYEAPLERIISDGLIAVGIDRSWIRGRRVLLKPNLVEPIHTSPFMTTNPAVVVATAEVFRRFGAKVQVGEGPGHVRDTELALVESNLEPALDAARLTFVDLNYDEIGPVANRSGVCKLREFHFPRAVLEADLVVSLPKLKTHHWVGMTASMKNLYGVMPGIKYGWPKNVLHHAGIPKTVVDINASLPKTMAVVDAIECMEGDGPIMGSRKHLGLVAVGSNLPALDATLARIMEYLNLAAGRLGPIDDAQIDQRGERWQPLVTPFAILDHPHLQGLRATQSGIRTSAAPPCPGRLRRLPCQPDPRLWV
jgi:uncharacterized protein (DUF362 family)